MGYNAPQCPDEYQRHLWVGPTTSDRRTRTRTSRSSAPAAQASRQTRSRWRRSMRGRASWPPSTCDASSACSPAARSSSRTAGCPVDCWASMRDVLAQAKFFTPSDTPTPTPSPTPLPELVVLAGDSNCDGLVNSIDAASILQFTAGLTDLPRCPLNADVNRSGDITSVDATLILQFTAGLLPSLSS